MKRGIIKAGAVAVALRVLMLAGAGEAFGEWLENMGGAGELMSAALSLELGNGNERETESDAAEPVPQPEEGEGVQKNPQYEIETVRIAVSPPVSEKDEEPQPRETATIIPTTISSDVKINNATSFEINIDEIAKEGLRLNLREGDAHILIIHTHASEAYLMDGSDIYEESDVSRTQDERFNVIRIGDELTEILEGYGLNVIHDRNIYDYPSYTGSYNRSGASVEQYLAEHPEISIVIDLHRDALGSGDVTYKTKAAIPGISCAQLMLLVGTGENGLYHPNWRENLKLALFMQSAMDEKYPSLSRPVALKPERYNQHLTNGSLILEVGSSGNTLQEALNAITLFGESVGPALAEFIEP